MCQTDHSKKDCLLQNILLPVQSHFWNTLVSTGSKYFKLSTEFNMQSCQPIWWQEYSNRLRLRWVLSHMIPIPKLTSQLCVTSIIASLKNILFWTNAKHTLVWIVIFSYGLSCVIISCNYIECLFDTCLIVRFLYNKKHMFEELFFAQIDLQQAIGLRNQSLKILKLFLLCELDFETVT